MAANPYMGNPFLTGAVAGFQGYQNEKERQRQQAEKQQQLAAMYGYRQQQLTDRESNAKSLDTARKEAEFSRREASGEFDGKPEAYVASVRQSMGLDNGSGSGNLGMTPTPADMGGGDLGTTPQPTDMGSGDLGTPGPSPVPRVSAMPSPIPGVGQGMPAVPPGPGLLQAPAAAPAQPLPGVPGMNALGALGARGIGPGAYSPPTPPPGFQMPNPLANGPVTRPQPFGAVPPAGMPPPSSMPPQNAMSPMGGPPQPFKPWGAPVSPYVPVGRMGGINPVEIATRQVQSAQAILDQAQQGIHYSPKALQQARETVDKGLDNLRQYEAQGLTGANDANKYISEASDKGADPFTLLSQLNNDRAGGANVEVPLRNVDRGLPESEWTKIEGAALDAHTQDPEHWQDAQYQGKPLSYYLDPNGNRLQVPDINLSAVGQANVAAKQAQARSADARTAYLGDQDTFLTKYRTKLTDAQVGMLEANKKAVLEGRLPVEQAQAAYDAIRNQYAPQTFQSTIDKNEAGTANLGVTADIGRQRLGGTYNPSGNTPGYLNPMQKQQFAGQQARLNKIETSLTQYENIKKSIAANTTYDAATRQRLMAAQDANIIPLQSEKARVQANLQQMSAPPATPTANQSSSIQMFNPTSYIGRVVNKDNAPACVDGVCYLASQAGVPVPKTRNAATFESQLPSSGWSKLPVSANPQPNDIIVGRGTGLSKRHVEWYAGNGKTVAADVRAGGYSNRLTQSDAVIDPTTTIWRYTGAPKTPQRTASSFNPSALKTMSTSDLLKRLASKVH